MRLVKCHHLSSLNTVTAVILNHRRFTQASPVLWIIRGSDALLTKHWDKCFQVSPHCWQSVWFTTFCWARGRHERNKQRFTGNFIGGGSYVTSNSVRQEISVMCSCFRFVVCLSDIWEDTVDMHGTLWQCIFQIYIMNNELN